MSHTSPRTAIDAFSGSGSATRYFSGAGWEVELVDVDRGMDIRYYHPRRHVDFVWLSPPCPEYSQGGANRTWEQKYNASRELWIEGLRVVWEARPRFWILENVKGAQQVWGRAPHHYGPYFLWGYYPEPKVVLDWKESHKGIRRLGSDERSAAERAVIPPALAKAVYEAVDYALDHPWDENGKRDFRAETRRARRRLKMKGDG